MANFPPSAPISPRSLPVVVGLGDSTIGYSHALSGVCSSLVNNGDGTATITFSSAQGVAVNDLIGIQLANNDAFKVRETPVIAVNGNAYTYKMSAGANPPTNDGAVACIRYANRASAAGPLTIAASLTNKRITFINAGQGGDTLTKMLARFDTDVAALAPDRVLFTAGINDVFGYNRTLAAMQADANTLLTRCRAIGAKLDVLTPFPQLSTRSGWTTALGNQFIAWRRWLIRWAADNGLLCFDWASCAAGTTQVQDPTSATASPYAGLVNADKVHPLNSASYLAAKDIAHAYSTIYPTVSSGGLPRNVTDGGLFSNPTLTGSGGTAVNGTGTVAAGPIATGLTVTNTAGTGTATPYQTARTIAADGDMAGNWQGVQFDAVAAGDTCQIKMASLHSQLANGDKVRVQCLVRITAGATLCKDLVASVLSQTATTGNLNVYDWQTSTTQQGVFPENFTALMSFDAPVRAPLATHGAPTLFEPKIQFTAASAGQIKVEVACWGPDKM